MASVASYKKHKKHRLWSACIGGYVDYGCGEEACICFPFSIADKLQLVKRKELLLNRSLCWNAMVAAYVQNGESKAALQLFRRMWQEDLISDKFTFYSTLSACADEGALAEGKRFHALLSVRGFDSDTMVGNAFYFHFNNLDNSAGGMQK